MNNTFRPRTARGFSLLEVLVAIVILSIGLLALAILQLNLIRSSTDAKAQSVALALAKEQIESLRAFHTWADYIALTDSTSTNSDFGTEYTITTTIDRFALFDETDPDPDYFDKQDDDTASDADMSAAGYIVGRDFKRASVEVTWVDAAGADNAVVLDDIIDGLIPADSARVAKNTAGAKPRTIQILINDPASEAGVIPIAINTNDPDAEVSTAATNPKPEIGGNNNSQRVFETRYDVLTYAGLASGDFLAQARVETTVLACTCDIDLEDEDEKGYRPTYWNGTRYVAPALATYTKPAGWTQEGEANPTESAKCTECCRDHHDPSGITGPKFDPRRVEATEGNQAHEHFKVLSDGTLQNTTDSDGEYTEACRMIRVDGIFRVAADMYADHYNLLETKNDGSAAAAAPSDAGVTNYQAFVLDYLDTRITLNQLDNTFNDLLASSDVDAMESTYDLNEPAELTLSDDATDPETDGYWLHSRGLYMDYLEPVTIEEIADAQEECLGTDMLEADTTSEKEACVLPLVPFTSINLTELSTWSPLTDDDLRVTNNDFLCSETVTDNDCDGIDADSPTRGKAYAGDSPTDGTQIDAIATILSSTAGVALLTAEIDDDPWNVDGGGVNQDVDNQPFVLDADAPNPPANYYTLQMATWMNSQWYSQPASFTSPSQCPWGNTNSTDEIATCSLGNNNSPTTTTVSWSDYNFGVATDSSVAGTGSLTLTCTTPTAGTVTRTKTGTGSQKYTVNKCRNFQIDSVTVNGTAQTISPTISGTQGEIDETTSVILTIQPNDEVVFTTSEQTAVHKLPTICTCTSDACTNNNHIVFGGVDTCP